LLRILVEVAGQPLLGHVFETAVDAGDDELVVIVGYEAAQIVDRFTPSMGFLWLGTSIWTVSQRRH
jgi:glucose-1-phosphate thymidylyltransferase